MRVVGVIVLAAMLGSAATAQEISYAGSLLWSGARDVAICESPMRAPLACCAFANGLVVLDLTDPAAPIHVGRAYAQGQGHRIALDGAYACLADGGAACRSSPSPIRCIPSWWAGCSPAARRRS